MIAADIFDEFGTFFIAVLNAVPVSCKTNDVETDEEDHGSEKRTGKSNARTECRKNRTKSTPEDRIADTGKRSDKTDFNAGQSGFGNFRTVGFLFFHSTDNTHNCRSNKRLGVEEFQMTTKSRLKIVPAVNAFQNRHHCTAETHSLHTLEVEGAEQEV